VKAVAAACGALSVIALVLAVAWLGPHYARAYGVDLPVIGASIPEGRYCSDDGGCWDLAPPDSATPVFPDGSRGATLEMRPGTGSADFYVTQGGTTAEFRVLGPMASKSGTFMRFRLQR
jgi:hypothetical protein